MNPDVAEAVFDPLVHFRAHGAAEARNPCPYFDWAWYLEQCPGLPARQINPFYHYLLSGAKNGYEPSPYFDSAWYRAHYADAAKIGDGADTLLFFIQVGEQRGDAPSERFDPHWYRKRNPDAANSNLTPFRHFLEVGRADGRTGARRIFRDIDDLNSTLSSMRPSISLAAVVIELEAKALEGYPELHLTGAKSEGALLSDASGERQTPGAFAFVRMRSFAHLKSCRVIGGISLVVSSDRFMLHDLTIAHLDDGCSLKGTKIQLADGKIRVDVDLRQAAWIEAGVNLMRESPKQHNDLVAQLLSDILSVEESSIPLTTPLLLEDDLHPSVYGLVGRIRSGRSVLRLVRNMMYHVSDLYQPCDIALDGSRNMSIPVVSRIEDTIKGGAAQASKVSPHKRILFLTNANTSTRLLNLCEIEHALAHECIGIVRCEELPLDESENPLSDVTAIITTADTPVTHIAACPTEIRIIVLTVDSTGQELEV